MQEFHFPTWVNKLTILLVLCAVTIGGYLATCLFAAIHPEIVNVGHQPKQPVPFSHKLHAGKLKLDCRYCHNTVEQAGHAAIPPTATCGNCHGGDQVKVAGRNGDVESATLGQIHPDSSLLAPVRESLKTNESVMWNRVHDLPDFVYFNHSAHINKGVSCVSCHGRIDKMDVVTQVKPLSMKWCIDCHRNPAPSLRDPALVTQLDLDVEKEFGMSAEEYGQQWLEKSEVNPDISCSTCHR